MEAKITDWGMRLTDHRADLHVERGKERLSCRGEYNRAFSIMAVSGMIRHAASLTTETPGTESLGVGNEPATVPMSPIPARIFQEGPSGLEGALASASMGRKRSRA